ncbi:photosynthetic complex assembly protein (plasmid) [Sulfitobacter alexandrii]|uniref:Photosynthetic complex assembly protein n=1 Tax=Sulfitobacter alexandrii TaxID=1917485 RepID=A0A1J0WMU5_9RHOB|nr:photosynthetic complex assembly protein PuhC [Sulfitobacter alexandrii]APE45676.1 photosynthetic complex assembly protein [Sulfitobacter alexandrii]
MAHQTSSLANQMKARDREMVPRTLVIAMFSLMAAALALVAFDQLTGQPLRGVVPHSPIAAERSITLEGTRSDGVAVLDDAGRQIAFSAEEKSGFIDVIWVSVTRERKVQGVTGNPPLTLARRENGHTAIIDPATGWSIDLIGYGADNVAAFARLID